MSKTSLRVTIIGAIVLLSCFLLISVLLNKNMFFTSNDDVSPKQSAFGTISDTEDTINDATTLDINFDKFAGDLKNQPDGKYIYGLGTSLIDFNYDAVWDYTTTPFWSEVKEVLKDESSLVLSFVQPQSMPYIKKDMKVEVVGCTESNTFMRVESQQINAIAIDFWAQVTSGDDLIGYCLNAECTQVGKLCKIYRD